MSGRPPTTEFSVQWGVRLWQILLYSGVSACDNSYCIISLFQYFNQYLFAFVGSTVKKLVTVLLYFSLLPQYV